MSYNSITLTLVSSLSPVTGNYSSTALTVYSKQRGEKPNFGFLTAFLVPPSAIIRPVTRQRSVCDRRTTENSVLLVYYRGFFCHLAEFLPKGPFGVHWRRNPRNSAIRRTVSTFFKIWYLLYYICYIYIFEFLLHNMKQRHSTSILF